MNAPIAIIGTGIFVLTGQAAAAHAGPAIVLSMVLAEDTAMALSMVVAPVTWSVVPAASVTAPVPRLPSAATLSVPAETVVVPE